jgi:hypothetical protein
LNASDVPDHELTTDIALPEKTSAANTAVDHPQAGPEDPTDRVPLPIAAAAPRPETAAFPLPPFPSQDEATHQNPLPPFQPPGGFVPSGPPPARRRGSGGRWGLALVAAMAVVAAGALAAVMWPGGGGKHPVAAVSVSAPPAPGGTASPGGGPSAGNTPSPQVSAPPSGTVTSAPPSPGPAASTAPAPAGAVPGGAVPSGTVPGGAAPNGLAMPYRTVQRDQGYFEGTVTVTNRTSAPLSTWELSFSYLGAQVRTVWGGVLVQAGSQVIIRNDPRTGPIPPGGTFAVKFGAGGAPSMPQSCRFGGRECGFTP